MGRLCLRSVRHRAGHRGRRFGRSRGVRQLVAGWITHPPVRKLWPDLRALPATTGASEARFDIGQPDRRPNRLH